VIEVLKVAIVFTLLCVVPFILAGLMLWAVLFMAIGVVLAVVEIVSVLKTGKTLSQQFLSNKRNATLVLCLTAFFLYLIAHLMLGV
jgi:hypothetical protein